MRVFAPYSTPIWTSPSTLSRTKVQYTQTSVSGDRDAFRQQRGFALYVAVKLMDLCHCSRGVNHITAPFLPKQWKLYRTMQIEGREHCRHLESYRAEKLSPVEAHPPAEGCELLQHCFRVWPQTS